MNPQSNETDAENMLFVRCNEKSVIPEKSDLTSSIVTAIWKFFYLLSLEDKNSAERLKTAFLLF